MKITDNLYEKLTAYGKSDYYPFHMPGHKRNETFLKLENSIKSDITEIDGFDNLHRAKSIIGYFIIPICQLIEQRIQMKFWINWSRIFHGYQECTEPLILDGEIRLLRQLAIYYGDTKQKISKY